MKNRKKFNTKLAINKTTIVNLDNKGMKDILGGWVYETQTEYSIDPAMIDCPDLTMAPCTFTVIAAC